MERRRAKVNQEFLAIVPPEAVAEAQLVKLKRPETTKAPNACEPTIKRALRWPIPENLQHRVSIVFKFALLLFLKDTISWYNNWPFCRILICISIIKGRNLKSSPKHIVIIQKPSWAYFCTHHRWRKEDPQTQHEKVRSIWASLHFLWQTLPAPRCWRGKWAHCWP